MSGRPRLHCDLICELLYSAGQMTSNNEWFPLHECSGLISLIRHQLICFQCSCCQSAHSHNVSQSTGRTGATVAQWSVLSEPHQGRLGPLRVEFACCRHDGVLPHSKDMHLTSYAIDRDTGLRTGAGLWTPKCGCPQLRNSLMGQMQKTLFPGETNKI